MRVVHLFTEVSFQNHQITPTQQLEEGDGCLSISCNLSFWGGGTKFKLLAMGKVN